MKGHVQTLLYRLAVFGSLNNMFQRDVSLEYTKVLWLDWTGLLLRMQERLLQTVSGQIKIPGSRSSAGAGMQYIPLEQLLNFLRVTHYEKYQVLVFLSKAKKLARRLSLLPPPLLPV